MVSIIGYRAAIPTPRFAMRRWFFWLIAITVAWCLLAFFVLANLPGFTKADGPPLYGLWALALGILAITGVVVWLLGVVKPDPTSLTGLKVHAALLTVFTALTLATSPTADGLSAVFEQLFYGFVTAVLGIEILIMAFAEFRVRMKYGRGSVTPFLYLGLVAATAGGLYAGGVAWTMLPPTPLLNAAEAAAGNRPYCLDVEGRAAKSRGEVSALRSQALMPRHLYSFRLLLLIATEGDRQYMNWSFRTGRFEPIGARARSQMRLDRESRCAPILDFSRSLR